MRDEEPISAVADVPCHRSDPRDLHDDIERMAPRGNVSNRHRAVVVQAGRDGTDGGVESCLSGREAAQMSERPYDADETVAAHAEIGLIVEEDDPAERSLAYRRREQCANDR